MHSATRALSAIMLVAAFTTTLLSGCSGTGPVYAESETAYTNETVLDVLANAEVGELASKPTAEGVRLRHDALAALRREGADASAVADLLTRTFPSSTTGVPVYVERARYDGAPAIIVVEATGPASGALSSKRVWVVGEKGDILFAGSR